MGCSSSQSSPVVSGRSPPTGQSPQTRDARDAGHRGTPRRALGVHITGDLTAYAHEIQIQEYRKCLGVLVAGGDPLKGCIGCIGYPDFGGFPRNGNDYPNWML